MMVNDKLFKCGQGYQLEFELQTEQTEEEVDS